MGFQLQSSGEWLYWLCFGVVIGLAIVGIWAVYTLGGLPGRIAQARGHPQAEAISLCGWLGLITFILWPVALIWAYARPAGTEKLAREEDLAEILADLRRTSERIAAMEAGLTSTPPRRIA